MKGILPFQPQALMVLKSLNFAQQVALLKKPVQTFSILAFQTNICELIEFYVKNQLRAKMEGPLLSLALLVRNTLYQKLHSQHAIDILICIYPSGIPIEIFFFAESMANRIRSLQRQAPLMPSKLAPGRLVLSSVALACSKSIPYLAQFL